MGNKYGSVNYAYGFDYKLDHYNVSNLKLFSIVLGTPKNDYDDPILLLNYSVDVDTKFYDVWQEKDTSINDTIYLTYKYYIDIYNKEMPIMDYAKYRFEKDYVDCDYDNWYNKNIVSRKGDYILSESNVE